MKKVFILLLFINLILPVEKKMFEIKEKTDNKLVISFKLEEYEIEQNGDYSTIKVANSGTRSLVGEPLLPSFSSFVKLDKYTSYDIDYNVISQEQITNINIMPLQSFKINSNSDFIKNKDIYSSNNVYPEKNLYISDRQAMRGIEFINLEINPFIYSPNDQKIVVHQEIEITIKQNNIPNQPISQDFPKSKVFERISILCAISR